MIVNVSFWDFLLLPIYIAIIYFLIKKIAQKNLYKEKQIYKYFILGFWLKIVAAVGYVLLIQYYYRGGDSFNYFGYGRELHRLVANNFENIKYFFLTSDNFYEFAKSIELMIAQTAPEYMRHESNFMAVRYCYIFGLFCFENYTITSVFFSMLSYIGIWKMVLILYKIYPQYKKQVSIAFLYIPSLLFWGSGILKESIALFYMGYIINYLFEYIYFKNISFKKLIILFIACFLLYHTKPYILFAVIIACLSMVYVKTISPWSIFAKITSLLFCVILFLIGLTQVLPSMMENDVSVGVEEELLNSVQQQQSFYEKINADDGVAYFDIGDLDPSITGIIKKIPYVLMSVFFRPFPWEARSMVLLFSMAESFTLLILFLYAVFKTGLIRFFKLLFYDPMLNFCFIFSVIIGLAVGFTTFNFGTVIRYKIPCMPFFVFLFLLTNKLQELQNKILLTKNSK